MSYKTLLAILHSEADAPLVLDFALPFASRHDSHLIGLHAEALPIVMATPMDGPVFAFAADFEEANAERHKQLREMATERARVEDVSLEWRGFDSISGDSAVSGIDSARSAELVITASTDPASGIGPDVEALLFQSGRPILFIPYDYKGGGESIKKPTIAWNGSKQAARAVFDALPLLKEAGNVQIVCVDVAAHEQQPGGRGATSLAQALDRHDIEVTIRMEQSEGRTDAETINDCLLENGSDLLVLGAFGRSKLAEFVFGGVTRSVLQNMRTPTLMAR